MSHFQVMIVLQKRVFGLVGLAAVLAAALAAKAGVTPGAVDIGLLKKALVAHGQVVPSDGFF